MDNQLSKLAQLVRGEKPEALAREVAEMQAEEAEADKIVNRVLEFVGKQPNCDDIFVAQELVEACADELRNRIRDMVEEGDEEP